MIINKKKVHAKLLQLYPSELKDLNTLSCNKIKYHMDYGNLNFNFVIGLFDGGNIQGPQLAFQLGCPYALINNIKKFEEDEAKTFDGLGIDKIIYEQIFG